MENNQKISTIPETAKEIRMTESAVRAWVLNNRIPVVRIGRRVFIHQETIKKILSEGLEAVHTKNN